MLSEPNFCNMFDAKWVKVADTDLGKSFTLRIKIHNDSIL